MFAAVGRIEATQATQGGDLKAIQSTVGDLKATSAVTATQSMRIADIAARKEKVEDDERKDARDASGKRWAWFEKNWQPILLAILLLAGVNLEPIARYFGMAPQVVVAAPIAAPPPAITPTPEPSP